MSTLPFAIHPAVPADHDRIEDLLDRAFGLDRRSKTSYRFREGEMPVAGLSFKALAQDGDIVGAISFWHLRIGDDGVPALLLGPLAVSPDLQGKGIGLVLMQHGIAAATDMGHGLILLVGDQPYYARAGFSKVPDGLLEFPGPVDPERLLYREPVPGALSKCSGLVLSPRRFSGPRDTT